MDIPLVRLEQFIDDEYEQFQREEDQAIMRGDLTKASHALAGKEACARLKRSLGLRAEMDRNYLTVIAQHVPVRSKRKVHASRAITERKE